MRSAPVHPAVTLTLLVVVALVSGTLVVGPEQEDDEAPPGVSDGSLEFPGALLDNHTTMLVDEGFSANGTVNVTIIRQNVLVDVQRTANRTVTDNASAYRQSQRSVADATVASLTRGEDFWGNETLEAHRRMENEQTTFNVSTPQPDNRLSAAAEMWPYLGSANYTLRDSLDASDAETPRNGKYLGGERRYVFTAGEIENATRITNRLPQGSSDPRNFTSTVVVDEDGRIHSFNASVDYTIQDEQRTHTITFELHELGVTSVPRPPWVDEAFENVDEGTIPNETETPEASVRAGA